MTELLQQLAEPFPPQHVTWKPGHTTKDGAKCLAMAYADLRAYQDRLDQLCGLDWSVRYMPWCDGRIICELTISGITRASTGEMEAQDEKNGMGGTVAEAQAFKRAAAMFGMGRYLYDLPSVWVAYDAGAKKISKEGQTELDNRYKAWYAKAIAASVKPKSQPKQPPPAEEDFGMGEKPENPFDAPAEEKATLPVLSDGQLKELHTIGREFYGDEWDEQRPKLVLAVSKGAISSSKELTPQEADMLIKGIKKKAADVAAKKEQAKKQQAQEQQAQAA